jgi:hypothetical protein
VKVHFQGDSTRRCQIAGASPHLLFFVQGSAFRRRYSISCVKRSRLAQNGQKGHFVAAG